MPLRQVLFGYHQNWMPMIAQRIDKARFQPSFAPLDAVRLERFDAVIPLKLAHYRDLEDRPSRNVLVPRREAVALCHDKLAFARSMIAAGFSANIPAVYEAAPPGLSIRKPRRGAWGTGCALVSATERPPADDDHFFQAIVEGHEEFACSLVRRDDAIRYLFGVRYTMAGTRDIRSGANQPKLIEVIDASPQLELFARILRALDYEGTCCFNYKFADGTPKILEINPRFGASIILDIDNYVEAYLSALAD